MFDSDCGRATTLRLPAFRPLFGVSAFFEPPARSVAAFDLQRQRAVLGLNQISTEEDFSLSFFLRIFKVERSSNVS